MTARQRMVPNRDIRRVLDLFRDYGLPIGAVDIREDGVTIHPPAATAGNAYDVWKAREQAKDKSGDRNPRR